MLEDLLGRIGFPIAIVLAALFFSIAWYNVNEDNRKADVRTACIKAGGSVDEHRTGWPTCTKP